MVDLPFSVAPLIQNTVNDVMSSPSSQGEWYSFPRKFLKIITNSAVCVENDYKARLISAVKKEVKQVMEESVTRKFVHEESGSVTSLCGAVEACLSQGKGFLVCS